MTLLRIILVSSSLFIIVCHAQRFVPGYCPSPVPQENFDKTKVSPVLTHFVHEDIDIAFFFPVNNKHVLVLLTSLFLFVTHVMFPVFHKHSSLDTGLKLRKHPQCLTC